MYHSNLDFDKVGRSIVDFLDRFKHELVAEVKNVVSVRERAQSTAREVDEVLSRREAAALLNCSLTTLCHYQKQGVIPFYKAGKKVLFKREELLDAIRKQVRKGGRHE